MIGQATFPDQHLISAAQRGDARSFGELVCRHRDGVLGAVYRLCGDQQLAEEATQEAFLRAWQHLDGYRDGNSFRAWLYRIAVNAALDELRRARPTLDIEDERLRLTGSQDDPVRAAETSERSGRVRKAILALAPASRSVLVLREFGGLSYAEIAAALEIPLGTVMSRLNSARAQLRPVLADLLEVE